MDKGQDTPEFLAERINKWIGEVFGKKFSKPILDMIADQIRAYGVDCYDRASGIADDHECKKQYGLCNCQGDISRAIIALYEKQDDVSQTI